MDGITHDFDWFGRQKEMIFIYIYIFIFKISLVPAVAAVAAIVQ